eukprot:1162063-Pelagomonas_calceolata.AAC.4
MSCVGYDGRVGLACLLSENTPTHQSLPPTIRDKAAHGLKEPWVFLTKRQGESSCWAGGVLAAHSSSAPGL